MKIYLRNSLSYYCFFVGLSIFLALTIGGYGLWKTGSFNLNNISSVYESGLILTDIKSNQAPGVIKELVQSDRVREALVLMDNLAVNADKLHQDFSLNTYEGFVTDRERVQKEMKSLISYPKQEMIIAVLNNKVNLFRNYVISNRWRTLTRMSRLMALKTSAKNVKSPGFFTQRKLKSFIRGIDQDLDRMAKVTNGSVLSLIDKNDINRRLDDMRVETAMLKKYVASLGGFVKNTSRMEKSFSSWVGAIGPEITLKRMHLEKTSHFLQIFFLSLVSFIALALVGGFFVARYTTKRLNREQEDFAFDVINQGLLPLEDKFDTSQRSDRFVKKLEKARERFHHRISFGSVFQEALPFSSLLLDSNLNLSWANDLFYEQWNIRDAKQAIAGSSGMSISWDFLQQYTNLGEDDPVQLALKNGIAGIYQVQLMSPLTQDSLPYEMYVSPVDYAGQKRIMIFFYPLRNMEETLSNQVQSITGPILRTLEEMSHQSFHGETQERLSNDFSAAGISKLFDKFVGYSLQVDQMQEEMHGEIEELEEQLREQLAANEHHRHLKTQRREQQEKVQAFFKKCQQALIELVELRFKLEHTFQQVSEAAEQGQAKQGELMAMANEALDRHQQSLISIDKMTVARDHIKKLKDQLVEHKTRLIQDLDHAVISAKRRGVVDDTLEKSLATVKSEVKNIELVLGDYAQVTKQLDIILSKAAMVIERKEAPDLATLQEQLDHFKTQFEQGKYNFSDLLSVGDELDTQVVESLKQLFSSYRDLTAVDHLVPTPVVASSAQEQTVPLS